jgi:hypothetical protein
LIQNPTQLNLGIVRKRFDNCLQRGEIEVHFRGKCLDLLDGVSRPGVCVPRQIVMGASLRKKSSGCEQKLSTQNPTFWLSDGTVDSIVISGSSLRKAGSIAGRSRSPSFAGTVDAELRYYPDWRK